MMIQDYFLNRKKTEQPEYQKILSELQNSLDSDLLSFLPHTSFLMLKPDAYLRGLMPDILGRLAEHEIYPMKYPLVELREDLIDNLYMFVKQKYYDTWWVMKKAYTLAPCLPVIVVGDPQEYPHLSARIRAFVGPTTPAAGHTGQLRYDLKATHRVFNLIHAADDPAAAVREALVFFDIDDLRDALQLGKEMVEERSVESVLVASERAQALVPNSPIDLRFERVKLDVKTQLLQILRSHMNAASTTVTESAAPLRELDTLIEREDEILSRYQPLREETRDLRLVEHSEATAIYLLDRKLDSQLESLARAESPIGERSGALAALGKARDCAKILELLADRVEFSRSAFDGALAEAVALGVSLESYEEVVLLTGWAVTPQELWDVRFGD